MGAAREHARAFADLAGGEWAQLWDALVAALARCAAQAGPAADACREADRRQVGGGRPGNGGGDAGAPGGHDPAAPRLAGRASSPPSLPWSSASSSSSSSSSSPNPGGRDNPPRAPVAFEDDLRKLRLALKFLSDCLRRAQRQAFALREACRTARVPGPDFAGPPPDGAAPTPPPRTDSNATPALAEVAALTNRRLCAMEANYELGQDACASVVPGTSPVEFSRLVLTLARGALRV